jgi:hypothetical protein
MADHLHGVAARNTSTFKISDRRSPKIVGTRAPIFLISLPLADLISVPSPAFTQAVSKDRLKDLICFPLR